VPLPGGDGYQVVQLGAEGGKAPKTVRVHLVAAAGGAHIVGVER
jgi:hypothetical protein